MEGSSVDKEAGNGPTTTDAAGAAKAATKKKERTIVVPPCPAAVSTAFCLLRGVAAAVVGARMSDCKVSLLQATYLKENRLSGKFSIHLGKKLGDCVLDLPESEEGITRLLDTIEAATNRIISSASSDGDKEQRPIACFSSMSKAEIEKKFHENGILDGSHKKTPADKVLTVAHLPGLCLAVLPSIPYASIASLKSLVLERNTSDNSQNSAVAAGKKARKAEITLKFVVSQDAQEDATLATNYTTTPADATSAPMPLTLLQDVAADWELLQKAEIRFPEGKELLEQQQKEAEQEASRAEAEARAKEAENAAAEKAALEKASAEKAAQQKAAAANEDEEEVVVNAWEVKGKIDYNKLVDQFGSTLIDDALMEELREQTVGKGRVPFLHRFLRRGMFFSHRDLHTLLNQMKTTGAPMYLYTGRGPSSESMHLGHLIPFLFTKWLQEAFDAPLVIQMTDDEKFLFKGTYDEHAGDNLDHFARLTMENARDIIACGFDYNKTFLFSDLDYVGTMYPNVVRIWKAVTTNTSMGIFGFDGSSNIGKIAFPAIQAAPSFASSFPKVLQANRESTRMCLIPCAIDQDPYFRMTRDVAHKLVLGKTHGLGGKPALIHSKFFPPLQGATGKMSSSDFNSAIFLTDTADDIKRKIKEHAHSGGQESGELQRQLGADLETDVSYQWLRFFLEDDAELEQIGQDYSTGKGKYWSTSMVKNRLIEVLQELVAEHQERKAKITDEEVRKWMTQRSIVG